jgi:hypothetical protein
VLDVIATNVAAQIAWRHSAKIKGETAFSSLVPINKRIAQVARTSTSYVAAMLCIALAVAGALLPCHADAAARSVQVITKNNTSRVMTVVSWKAKHGEITRQPSSRIPPSGTGALFAESHGIATGTEWWVKYRLDGVPGEVQFNWDNPFVDNSASGSAPTGYAIEQVGDKG